MLFRSVRAAYEYQGQKCSAATRAYIPESLWEQVKNGMLTEMRGMNMGSQEDFESQITAVINQESFKKIAGYLDLAKASKDIEVVAGGGYDDSRGYFVEPTLLRSTDPSHQIMCEEIFGPVLCVYVYPDREFEQILGLVNRTSPYALTGSVFARDRYALDMADRALENAAGNFYINDKPTGGTPGLQPFGGARASGTNDKVGSTLNLTRWMSARTIKENYK